MNMQATYIVLVAGVQVFEGSRHIAHAAIVDALRKKVGIVTVRRVSSKPVS